MPILFSINVADESFESELLYVPSRNGYEICNIPLFICATEHKESGTLWDSNHILSVRGTSLELMISRSAYCAKRSSWIAFCAFIVLFCGSSIYFCASLICFAALSNLSCIQKRRRFRSLKQDARIAWVRQEFISSAGHLPMPFRWYCGLQVRTP